MTTAYGYKLFNKDTKGNLHPLYVNANQIIPVNQWLSAECGEMTPDGKVKSKLGKLAYRGGWHLNEEAPYVTHIYGKNTMKMAQRSNRIQVGNLTVFRSRILYGVW